MKLFSWFSNYYRTRDQLARTTELALDLRAQHLDLVTYLKQLEDRIKRLESIVGR